MRCTEGLKSTLKTISNHMDPVICNCKNITKKEIEAVIKKLPNCSLEEVIAISKASTGCGRCRPLVKKIVETTKRKLPENNQLFIEF